MIRKINTWTIEKEYIDSTYKNFNNNKLYAGTSNGSVNGSGRGDGFKIYFSKIHKCEVSCILGENFYGLGGDEINDIHTYVKYVY